MRDLLVRPRDDGVAPPFLAAVPDLLHVALAEDVLQLALAVTTAARSHGKPVVRGHRTSFNRREPRSWAIPRCGARSRNHPFKGGERADHLGECRFRHPFAGRMLRSMGAM